MFQRFLLLGLLLPPILQGSQKNIGHEVLKDQNEKAFVPNISCKTLTKFLQSHFKAPSCIKDLKKNFSESQKALEFLESSKETRLNVPENFFDKCSKKEKETILPFYLITYNLRQELLKDIQEKAEFSRLNGQTSFHRKAPLLDNAFQGEQLQKINSLTQCSPQDAHSTEIVYELKRLLLSLKDVSPIPENILALYPLLKEKEFKSFRENPNYDSKKIEQTFIDFIERKEKEATVIFDSKQKLLQCLLQDSLSRDCTKRFTQAPRADNSLLSFLKILDQNEYISLCYPKNEAEKNNPCLLNKPKSSKKDECEISFLARNQKDYRLCKVNHFLKQENLTEIESFDVKSFDKNILNEKKSLMGQKWSNLLFLHYRVDPKELQKLIPPPLELDLHNNEAWISVVPFKMSSIKPGNITNVVPNFPEINVRTYVKYGEQRGVYFLTLDASNKLVVKTSSLFPGLPYKQAKMTQKGDGSSKNPFSIKSTRTEKYAPHAEFEASYEVTTEEGQSVQDDLSKFLIERYRFFGVNKDGTVIKTDINHEQWPVKKAQVNIKKNTMLDSIKEIKIIDSNPLVQYVEEMDVKVWAPKEVGREKLAP